MLWRLLTTTPRNLVTEELERLALLSPHLLADLGFRRDAAVSSSDRTTWRRGPLRVVLRHGHRAACATADR